ncbi:DUF799 domain-containing protein [Rhodoferax sp.]|uniref:DUF799 domain-containing protein n=1 Tax=Rhodoferax sp. TaxID=50421 RepID=UPI00374D4AA9
MTTTISRLFLVLIALLLTACATQKPNYDYAAFRESKPSSILVLPPLNQSPDIRATYSVLSTVTAPLAESGYYVFPVAVVDQTFKENGLDNPGEMHQASLAKISEIFGADAVFYITIEQYGNKYQVIDSSTVVSASAKLVDVRTGKLLWQGRASASDAENRQNNNGGLVGLLVTALVRQVIGSVGDPGHQVSAMANSRLLRARAGGLLYGPRSPQYQKD